MCGGWSKSRRSERVGTCGHVWGTLEVVHPSWSVCTGIVVHVLNLGLVAPPAVQTVICRGTQCTMDLTFGTTVGQNVVQSNPSAEAPGLVLPESQMTGDAEQVPVIFDPDSDSEVDPSVDGDVVVEESDGRGSPRGVVLRMALRNLDDVDPRVLFRQRALVMRSVPRFLHGPFRNVLKMALEEALEKATWGIIDRTRHDRREGGSYFGRPPRKLPT